MDVGRNDTPGSVYYSPRHDVRRPGPDRPAGSAPRPPGVSWVIPAYNEEKRVGPTLEAYLPVLQGLGVPYEVIVSSSGEDATPEIARRYHDRGVISLHTLARRGKGLAILEGFRQAHYGIVGYSDADGSVPPEDMRRLLQAALAGDRVVIASRRLEPDRNWVRAPAPKYYASNVWHSLVRVLLDLPVRDAECGFKIFTHGIVDRILREVTVTNWVFDACMLYHVRASGETLREMAVNYRYHHGTHFRLGRVAPVMLAGLLCVFAVNRLDRRALPMRFLRAMNYRFSEE